MPVKLISYSRPNPGDEFNFPFGVNEIQDLVAYCARVSNPNNQNNSDTSEKLIKYLIKHKHWSPLEMVSACLEIETTRDIALFKSLVRDMLIPRRISNLRLGKHVYRMKRTDRIV